MSVADEIKARLDIVDVISSYIPLKKAGRNYKANCPFHSEKTPSFVVFPETQSWHCFGACGTGGDLFSFVTKYENLDFGETLKLLAQKAGVTLESPQQSDIKLQQHLEKLFDIHAAAVAYFQDMLLHSPQGQLARDYVARRGLNAETVQMFQLGFAPDNWQALSDHLSQRGYQREDLLECGLIIPRDDGGYYDRFRARLMIPIRDIRGRVIGFGGRVLDKGEPKYLNSPQTPLFNKGDILFGIDLAKGAIRARGQVVIVEGYMDVLQAHQASIGNVVASMGTALTERQLELLKRMTKKYILALDPDAAGDQGTLRGLAVARQTLDKAVPIVTSRGWIRYESRLDADIRIMTLPPGQDPDDLIRDKPELWDALVESAIPVVDYYFQVVTADLNMGTAKDKSEAVRRLVPILAEISDQVVQTHYIQKLARLVRMDEPDIRRQLGVQSQLRTVSTHKAAELDRRKKATAGGEPQPSENGRSSLVEEPAPSAFALEEYCLAALLRRPDWIEQASQLLGGLSLASLREDDFASVENRALFVAWQRIENGTSWQEWVERLPQSLQVHLNFLLENGPDAEELTGENAKRDWERNILWLRYKKIDQMVRNLVILQTEALDQGDAKASEYSDTILTLSSFRHRLDDALHATTSLGKRQARQVAPREQVA